MTTASPVSPASARIRSAALDAVRRWRVVRAFDAALLYGSAAWGDADDGSDADVMLLYDRGDQWTEVTRLRDDTAEPALSFDVVHASWPAFAHGVAGGWWLARLAAGVVLWDGDQRLAQMSAEAQAAWSDPRARAARADQATGHAPEPGTDAAAGDAWYLAVVAAAQAVLLAHGVPPSGHHLLGRLQGVAGEAAVHALIAGAGLPRTGAAAAERHAAAVCLLRWARGVADGPRPDLSEAQTQMIRFALSAETESAVETAAQAWRVRRAWAQWGLASRDLARIAVLRNVAPLLAVRPEPAALGAWLCANAPRLAPLWWEALGLAAWTPSDLAESREARRQLAGWAREGVGAG